MPHPTSHVRIFNTPTRPVRVFNSAALQAEIKALREENAAADARIEACAAQLAAARPKHAHVLNALADYHQLIRVAAGNGTPAARLQRLYGAN